MERLMTINNIITICLFLAHSKLENLSFAKAFEAIPLEIVLIVFVLSLELLLSRLLSKLPT